MRKASLAVVLCFLALAPVNAFAQACGAPYTVQRGDTLSQIASTIFGDAGRWGQIYEHRDNALTIGSNPNALVVGAVIDLPPCPAPGATQAPQIRETAAQRRQRVPSQGYVPIIEIVTGGDYAPFTDENVEGRGMATQIVEAAFAASDLPNPVIIEFVNDWASHLNKLVPRNKYDFAFPWYQPDCSRPDTMGPGDVIRCEYIFSEQPVYTVTMAFFGPVSDPNPPQRIEDLRGRRLCRPRGYLTFDLVSRGLTPGVDFVFERPQTVGECFAMLEKGLVDYVAINRFTGEAAVIQNGLTGFVEPVKTLVIPLGLHLLAHRDNAEAAYQWMLEFDEGMRRIKESGEWDDIVGFHLELHRAALKK